MIETIKAVVADIDMTLTVKGGDLPQEVIDAFEILHRNGILLGLATGREISDPLLHQGRTWGLSFEFDFIIGMNGGMIYDQTDQSSWASRLLTEEELKEMLLHMKPLIDQYCISVNAEGGGNHNAMNIHGDLFESMKRRGFVYIDKTGDIDGFCNKPAYKILFRCEEHDIIPEIRSRFMGKFSDQYQMTETFPGTIEAFRKGFNKGTGMKKFADKHHIDMKDVIGFGDNENDNPLLEMCGLGVALENASDSTKEIADDMTRLSCEHGGVGVYLMENYIIPNDLK